MKYMRYLHKLPMYFQYIVQCSKENSPESVFKAILITIIIALYSSTSDVCKPGDTPSQFAWMLKKHVAQC